MENEDLDYDSEEPQDEFEDEQVHMDTTDQFNFDLPFLDDDDDDDCCPEPKQVKVSVHSPESTGILIRPRKIVHLTRQKLLEGISAIHLKKCTNEYELEKVFGKVTHLHLQRKGIDILTELDQFRNLTVLYLYGNRICEIRGLEGCVNLEILDMHDNRVNEINGLTECTKLKRLNFGQNHIGVIEGIDQLDTLEELHIEYQKLDIGEMVVIDPFVLSSLASTLRTLDISGNGIYTIEDLAGFEILQELIAKDNDIGELDVTTLVLTTLPHLAVIDFRGNPIVKIAKYREKMIGYVNHIVKLDDKDIQPATRYSIQQFWKMKTDILKSAVESYTNPNNSNNDMYNLQYQHQGSGLEGHWTRETREKQLEMMNNAYYQMQLHNQMAGGYYSQGAISNQHSTVPNHPFTSQLHMHSDDPLKNVRKKMSLGKKAGPRPSGARSKQQLLQTRPNQQLPNPQFVLTTQNFLQMHMDHAKESDPILISRNLNPNATNLSGPQLNAQVLGNWSSILSPIPGGGTEEEDESISTNIQGIGDGEIQRKKSNEEIRGPEPDEVSKDAAEEHETTVTVGDTWNQEHEQRQQYHSQQEFPRPFKSNVFTLPSWPHIQRLGAREPIVAFIP